jgi:hypothetical protein
MSFGLSGGSVGMVLNQSPRRMSWQMSGLIVWVGLIGAANVSLPRYFEAVVSFQLPGFRVSFWVLTPEN